MANATILGAPRLSLGGTVAGNNPVTMPATNLNNDEPSEKCRMDSADPVETYIYVPSLTYPFGYYGETFGVGGIGVVNHNLSIGATARTLLLDADADGFLPERVVPNSVTLDGAIFTAGTAADIDDDPYDIDAAACLTTTTGSGNVVVDFATPSATPATGSSRQLVRVHLTYSGVITAFNIEVRDGSTTIANWDAQQSSGVNPIPDSGAVLLVYFDAVDLSTADGSGVNARIAMTVGSGQARIEAVDWLCDSALTAGAILYDSGWEIATYDVTDALWGSTVAGAAGSAPTQNYVHFPTTEVTGVAQAVTFFRDPFNTSGYVDVGCYVLGPRFRSTINRAWGPLVGVRDLSVKRTSHGGQTFGVKRPRLRTLSLPLHELSVAEAHSLLDRVNWRKGTLSPVLVSLFPGDATEGRHTTLWCTVEQMDEMAANFFGDFRAMNLTFLEKL